MDIERRVVSGLEQDGGVAAGRDVGAEERGQEVNW